MTAIGRSLWVVFAHALDVACRAEKATLTSPSGEVEVVVCEGWCGYWCITAHGRWAQGWRWRRADMRPYAEQMVRLLALDMHTEAARELEGVTNA